MTPYVPLPVMSSESVPAVICACSICNRKLGKVSQLPVSKAIVAGGFEYILFKVIKGMKKPKYELFILRLFHALTDAVHIFMIIHPICDWNLQKT